MKERCKACIHLVIATKRIKRANALSQSKTDEFTESIQTLIISFTLLCYSLSVSADWHMHMYSIPNT